ncbi:S8 family peptidase [Candidatus Venteria ishoeyi]|uniref:S8 family peptidase n=1 Tax=Candidatus Venteria ishoeyi TaxID=1899563 RepID=UPI0025A51FB0|nr:S8 family peptidase [Candidatus Venteria ishoeyi]MDM8546974.1 S8 family peptidase [Candidatus Venteria ishoeyi]
MLLLTGCGGSGSDDNNGSWSDEPDYPEPEAPAYVNASGVLAAAGNTAVDSDVNDPNANYRDNNGLEQAQTIPNPVTLGGYVNEAFTGSEGRSYNSGDAYDFFAVELLAGQTITLLIASPDLIANDLDLGLFDAGSGELLDASVSIGNTESLSIRQNGHYIIQVEAFSGYSNYVLSIGQHARLQQVFNPQSLRLSDDFAVAEVITRFKPKTTLSALSQQLSGLSLQHKAGKPEQAQLLSMDLSTTLQKHVQSSKTQAVPLRFKNLKTQRKYQTLMAIKQLQKQAGIQQAAPNYQLQALRVPNDRHYARQWHYPLINLPQAWDITTGSGNVIVAVVDTGVLLNHPDLRNKIGAGYDFISDTDIAMDGDGIDSNADDPGDQSPNGSTFHGSHVAGTIAASSDNDEGVAGIGWHTQIMPLRVLGKNGAGNDYSVAQAVRFAAGLSNSSGQIPAQRADVLNLSLGGPMISAELSSAIAQARTAGVLVVAAAGNNGNSQATYPAALEGVISVAAVGPDKRHASYSNTGATIDIAAPGGSTSRDLNGDGIPDGIFSTNGDDSESFEVRFTYGSSVGTSMATPHIAGVLALMKAVNANLSPNDFDELLSSGRISEDLGSNGRDNLYGYGLIDAHQAVLMALEIDGNPLPPPLPALSVQPASLNFGSFTQQLEFTVSNAGGGDLFIRSVHSDRPDVLNITALNTDSNGLGRYQIELQRSGLARGTYGASLEAETTQGVSQTIPMIWQVGSQSGGDAGTQYVLMIDPDSQQAVDETQVKAYQGHYDFYINDLPEGSYIIFSGSDMDNNGYICEAGESCGAYLTLENPTQLLLERSQDNIDFDVQFDTEFLSISSQAVATDSSKAQKFARPES